MRYNIPAYKPPVFTHEGARAKPIGPKAQLRRSILSCMLWEKEFYENGQEIAARIQACAAMCPAKFVAELAIEARANGLRHAPLLLLLNLISRPSEKTVSVAETIAKVLCRADEPAELLALYWAGKKRPLAKQLKKGLALAMGKFDEYQLAKYNRPGQVRLRDVLFLSHPKPDSAEQAGLFRKLANGQLAVPDTWETQLSAGADKRETFERLLRERKLGYLALLRNLRNMQQAGVDRELVFTALKEGRGSSQVFPFRYVAAARAVPEWDFQIDEALQKRLEQETQLSGKTIVLVDVSGSMDWKLSAKSDMTRLDAAAALASMISSESLQVFTFSEGIVEVPPRRGMAGVDAVCKSQVHNGTRLGEAIEAINQHVTGDRLIVITDEQSADRVGQPRFAKSYMINVASNRNGVGYGSGWTHLDGFSEAVLKWIAEFERTQQLGEKEGEE